MIKMIQVSGRLLPLVQFFLLFLRVVLLTASAGVVKLQQAGALVIYDAVPRGALILPIKSEIEDAVLVSDCAVLLFTQVAGVLITCHFLSSFQLLACFFSKRNAPSWAAYRVLAAKPMAVSSA